MIAACASRLGVTEAALRAVLAVECGSTDPAMWLGLEGRAIVRVEAHHVLRRLPAGDHGLRVGSWRGGPGEPARPWEGHEVRIDGGWAAYHGRQERTSAGLPGEYDALDVAAGILPDGWEGACACSSWGPGQVLGSNAAALGVGTAIRVRELAETPEGGLELVARFLERVKPWALESLRRLDWLGVATAYNGPGKAAEYAGLLAREHGRAS